MTLLFRYLILQLLLYLYRSTVSHARLWLKHAVLFFSYGTETTPDTRLHIYQGCLRLSVRTRCGFLKSKILRSGSVRFEVSGNLTVRFGAVFRYCNSFGAVRCGAVTYPTVRFGAVLKNRKSYGGSVRFSEIRNPTVRFGAVFRDSESYLCGSVL